MDWRELDGKGQRIYFRFLESTCILLGMKHYKIMARLKNQFEREWGSPVYYVPVLLPQEYEVSVDDEDFYMPTAKMNKRRPSSTSWEPRGNAR